MKHGRTTIQYPNHNYGSVREIWRSCFFRRYHDKFFLEELRKIYGDGRVIHDPQFVGECCYGSLGDLRVKARFTKDIVANQYPYLTVSILNPTKGEIDSVRMKIGDVVSRSCRSTNPNLRNTEPHIWVDGKMPQWYACCPGSRDYTLLANATAEYLSVFELTHERVQNRQHTQKMKGADAHER